MHLAAEKTEVLILKRPRNRKGVKMKLGNEELTVKKEIKYVAETADVF